MVMSKADIVREYNQAKQPLKQIGILADQNQTTKQEIAEILREAGAKLPQQFTPRKVSPEITEAVKSPEVQKLDDAAAAAVSVIGEIIDGVRANHGTEELRALFQIEGVLKMFFEVAL